MHTYERRWADDPVNSAFRTSATSSSWGPSTSSSFAELDPLVTWRTLPAVWHLDEGGAFRCASRGSSLCPS